MGAALGVPGEVWGVPGERAVHSAGLLVVEVVEVGAGTAWRWGTVGAMGHSGVPGGSRGCGGAQWGARGLSRVPGGSVGCQGGRRVMQQQGGQGRN